MTNETASTPEDGESPSMSPADLYARLRRGDPITVVDVRNRDEVDEWAIAGESVTLEHVPLTKFVQAEVTGSSGDLVADLPEPMVVVCARGESSDHVAGLLRADGVDAVNLAGGMEGWARVYVAEELDQGSTATVLQYQRPSSGCLAYLVVSGDEAVVVDPLRAFADRYVADARERGAELVAAVDTHVHADHVSGVRDVAAATDAAVVLPAKARDRGLDFEATLVGDGHDVRVGDAVLTAYALPGHTSELLGYRLRDGPSDTRVLFSGDTVFLSSVARPDLESGDVGAPAAAHRLYETLQDRVLTLLDDVLVAPGHYADGDETRPDGTYTATVATLRDRLAPLSMDESAFVGYVLDDMPPRPANYEEIIETNLGRATVDDDRAFELELGPNNCAASAD